MRKAIIGAGGFGKEVYHQMRDCGYDDIIFFVDDIYAKGNIMPLSVFDTSEFEAVVAIGDSAARAKVVNRLPKDMRFFTFIHKSVIIPADDVIIGTGSIICAGCILTTNINIGCHAHLNLQTTIGHDCVIGDFFTTAPGVKISGNCNIGDRVYIGTNASTREKINILDDITVGLNAGVVRDLTISGTYIGSPARLIKK